MRPSSGSLTRRPDLGVIAYETLTSAPTMGYIGLQVMPPFRVPEQTADYPVMPKEALFNLLDTARGPLGHYNRGEDEFERGKYSTSEHGLERRIDDRFAAIYSSEFAYETAIANILMQNILRAQEYRIAAKIINTSNFTAHNASVAWGTHATASPKADIEAGKTALRALGIVPNALILPWSIFQDLQFVTEIKTQVYQIFPDAAKTGQITMSHLQTYFDVPKIMVAGALYNASNNPQAANLSDIWGSRYAMLCRVAEGDSADVIEPCIGRTFYWNEGANQEVIVERYRDENVRSDVLRVRHDVQEAFLASYDDDNVVVSEISKACGYLIDTTAAS